MSDNAASAAHADDQDASGTQYLTLLLDGEQYGLDILQVQEIRGWESVTRIPNTPPYLQGVINLRGTIVPVLDLRMWFGLPVAPCSNETVVIVVRAAIAEGGERSLGLVVDAVSDVLVAHPQQIIGAPDFGSSVQTENIIGLVSGRDAMVMLLDIPSLITMASANETIEGA